MRTAQRLALLLLLTSALSYSQSFTLEQILSSPFPTGLTAAKQSNRIAWIFNAKGVRNVWVADGPDYTRNAHPVTSYTEDDGQAIASVQLTPDGKTVVYARGSEANDAGEVANPTSSVKGVKQQVFALDVDAQGTQPRLLGDLGVEEEGGEDIRISPDGKSVVWAARKKLWLASIDGKQQGKDLAVFRGSASQPKWSPDGKHIAFVSSRGDHSLIAVYDVDGASIRFLAPSTDRDSMPRWSPDGKQIAFIRVPGSEQKLPLIPVHPQPWSLWIADASTGNGHKLWQSGDQLNDSLPQLTADVSLHFAAGSRIVFASEQDGTITSTRSPPPVARPRF